MNEQVFAERDGKVDWILTQDNEPLDLAAVTRIDLVIRKHRDNTEEKAVSVSTPLAGTERILWNQASFETGEVELELGTLFEDFDAGRWLVQVFLYDAANTNGLYHDTFPIHVIS